MRVKFRTSISGHRTRFDEKAPELVSEGIDGKGQEKFRRQVTKVNGNAIIDQRHEIIGFYSYDEGQIYDLEHEEAQELIAAGYCHEVDGGAEKAVVHKGRRSRG